MGELCDSCGRRVGRTERDNELLCTICAGNYDRKQVAKEATWALRDEKRRENANAHESLDISDELETQRKELYGSFDAGSMDQADAIERSGQRQTRARRQGLKYAKEHRRDGDTRRQKEREVLLIAGLRKYRWFSSAEAAEMLGVTVVTARKALLCLVAQDIVVEDGHKDWPRWMLRATRLRSRDKAYFLTCRGRGTTQRGVYEALECAPITALNILNRLMRDGLVARTENVGNLSRDTRLSYNSIKRTLEV